jgi:hypothetical protein
MLATEDNKLMFGGLPTDSSAQNWVKAEALRRCGLALRGLCFQCVLRGATGLSATSPRSFLAVGFSLLSLAEGRASYKVFQTLLNIHM